MRLYVINLDRSPERWAKVETGAGALALPVTRVPGVDGRTVPVADWVDVDHRRFRLWHGRTILPGEYGCYRSHLQALRTFLSSGERIGIVCEDDVVLHERAPGIAERVLDARPGLDMLKLANHRTKGFVSHGGEGAGEFGRCVHGPQGSAAAYAVTRKGAELLLAKLAIMWLPYDVAFERGWDMGAELYTLRHHAVRFREEMPSTIAGDTGGTYGATKAILPLRLPTALFRARDYVLRARYSRR